VLLLDDVFSELDDKIVQSLKELLDGRHQIFVTSPVSVDWVRAGSEKVFRVDHGQMRL
jgi:recombinational DNA repair ATPase RecF